ncbi:multiple sugar transport system permease protein [Kribbella sp. VKM Ac-2527]|uniref:Multiple sugar transport system permease protein n=1 Tax=Kribbella caucasensis TaxID=2512215 RepID=A0A4R6KK58_9ACTN|nr:carbohydrate ABC transporter permease [Kribbella sp. VKM Ac-2527]TDO51708.1 multiple sugar transport system permease protein [Kribbella sp. VKM Ac-2527]
MLTDIPVQTPRKPLPPPAPEVRRSARRKGSALVGTLLLAGALLIAFPFLWMVFASVKPRSESVAYPPALLPKRPTFDFYVELFVRLDFGRYLLNTLLIVVICMFGLLAMAAAGYGFAKFRFRGRSALFFLVLVTMMIPGQVTMIPSYLILDGMHLTNTIPGIALPMLVSGFSIFLFRQFMTTIPNEVIEAARIDGAGEWRIFARIILPMSRPILAVQVVLTFIAGWNAFLWPLIIANDPNLYTLSVGLSLLNQQLATNPSLQMAASTLMIVPILVVFVVFQRHIVQGFALSGLK